MDHGTKDPTGSRALAWWQHAVIYQIYPRSFQDSNGDGVGDLRGMIRRLPYLSKLGIDAVWVCPIFCSPMADFGYDVSNYSEIDPLFGTMHDFEEFLAAAHQSGLKVVLDLVPNHTSEQHPWFGESRRSRDDAKRSWYLWRDPGPRGGPPNNWLSNFGGSAWEFDRATGQYYYHAFLKQQPDLNWRNPEVRRAIYEVMRTWLRRGVDGFRVDVLASDQRRSIPGNPPNPSFAFGRPPHEALIPVYTADRPEIHDIIAEMRRVLDEFDDRLLIGEIYLPVERLVSYYGRDLGGVHLPFNFALLSASWHAATIYKLVEEYEAALPPGGWPNWVLGNHDRPRIASRIGGAQARIAAILLLTLRGTPTLYYGDEIEMIDVPIPTRQVRDPLEMNVPGLGIGRDGCRTPMQWDSSENAGFSQSKPWLPVAPDFHCRNVDTQRRDATSLYNLYRRLIGLRRARRVLVTGSYQPIKASGDLFLFVRQDERDRLLVALNFGEEPVQAALVDQPAGKFLLSSRADREGEDVRGVVSLRPYEGGVIELRQGA